MDHEVIYDRNLTGSYMKISTEDREGFDEKILLQGKQKGLLGMERSFYNGRPWYWYNISGKQSLDTYCKIHSVGMDMIRQIVLSVSDEMEIMEWNLLDPNNMVLDPEYIFISNMSGEVIFTAYPGYRRDVSKQLQELLEYLLTKMDHSDPGAVKLAYEIYEKTLDEDYSIIDIRGILLKGKSEESGGGEDKSAVEEKNNGKELNGVKEKSRFCIDSLSSSKSEQKELVKGDGEEKSEGRNYNSAHNTEKRVKISEGIRIFIETRMQESAWYPVALKIMTFLGNIGKQKEREKNKEKSGKENKKTEEEVVVFPDDIPEEETMEIHPTICLASYCYHPKGVLVYEGAEKLEDIKLNQKAETRIGQSPEVDFKIPKDTISQFHARILYRDEEYLLEDLNSTNGTYINEEMLAYKEIRNLKHNDIVRFADVRFRFL